MGNRVQKEVEIQTANPIHERLWVGMALSSDLKRNWREDDRNCGVFE